LWKILKKKTVKTKRKKNMAGITEDEAALYDRQIRLWGLEAQQRFFNSFLILIFEKIFQISII